MKIFFVGGGTGGHFFPNIAVAEAMQDLVDKEHFVAPKLFYFAATPFNKSELYKVGMEYIYCPSGKLRIGNDFMTKIRNFVDIFVIGFAVIYAFVVLTRYYPDVIFSKGGNNAFAPLVAAKLLGIPVIIHDSDSIPGRVSLFSASFAKKIALTYPEAEHYFTEKEKKKIALTGLPIRKEILEREVNNSYSLMDLDPYTPVLFILGGSQGAEFINENILDALQKLVEKYQVIHQTGDKHFKNVLDQSKGLLRGSTFAERYRPFPTLNSYYMRVAFSVSKIVITRAGSGLFEVASWGKPAIIIPMPESVSRDQKSNSYAYARLTGAIVIEQQNLHPSILLSEIDKLINNKTKYAEISKSTKQATRPAAARTIAKELLDIALKHI